MNLSFKLCLLLGVFYGFTNAQRSKATTSAPSKNSGGDLTDECPEPNGYFADGYQCDKYYECKDGVIEEKLCPDGMVFNDYSPQVEKCDLPFNIDCSQRPELQKPQPTPNCPRLNGYFAHDDPKVCDKFYYCVDGKYNMITCPAGLVYNERTGICTWPDEAKKKGCSSQGSALNESSRAKRLTFHPKKEEEENGQINRRIDDSQTYRSDEATREVFRFDCPKVDMTRAQQHPRYPDPEDCQFFYVCINGETPRRNGCKMGQVFNEATGNCDWPRNVPECKEWYKGILTDEELYALEHPKPRNRTAATGHNSRRRPAQQRVPVDEEELL